jgi:hypothetical protein
MLASWRFSTPNNSSSAFQNLIRMIQDYDTPRNKTT